MSIRAIFGTNIQQPPSKTIEEIRSGISHLRGQLSDLGSAYPGWKERLANVEGLLTCGLVTLHDTMEECRKHELQFGHTPPTESR